MSNSQDDLNKTPNLRIGIIGGVNRNGLPPLGLLLSLIASGAVESNKHPRSLLGDLFGEGSGRGSNKTPPAGEREIPMEVAEMIMEALFKDGDGCGECDGCKSRAAMKEAIAKERAEQGQEIVKMLPRSVLKINEPLYMIDDFLSKDGLATSTKDQRKSIIESLDVITAHIGAIRDKIKAHGKD